MLSIQGVTIPESKKLIPSMHSLRVQNCVFSAHTIPYEVIAHIFVLAYGSSCDPISQSISLSHVCRRWRDISLSMPFLWTSIFLSFPLSNSQLARTITWITRSRNSPLDIYMNFRDPAWDWNEASHIFDRKAMDGVMHILVPHASRWRSIELFTDTWAPIFIFLSSTVAIDSAPLLQTVRLARCNEYFVAQGRKFRPEDLASPIAWFKGGACLSHLRRVSLSGVHVDWKRSGLAGLQELELRYHARGVMPTLTEFRHILRENATLKRLVILGWGFRTNLSMKHQSGQDGLEPVALPQLEELKLGFVSVEHGTHLLSLFALKNLRSLSIEDVALWIQCCEYQDYSPLLNRLVELSTSGKISLPLVRALSLRSIRMDVSSIKGLFAQLHAIKSLCLKRVDAKTLAGICFALQACDGLKVLTLKELGAAEVASVLSSQTLPPRLRILLNIDEEEEEEEEEDAQAAVDSEDY